MSSSGGVSSTSKSVPAIWLIRASTSSAVCGRAPGAGSSRATTSSDSSTGTDGRSSCGGTGGPRRWAAITSAGDEPGYGLRPHNSS